MPEDDPDGKEIPYKDYPLVDVTAGELFADVAEAMGNGDFGGDTPFYNAVTIMYPKVCPESLLTEELVYWIMREGDCARYHCLPFGNDLMQQPQKIMEIFEVISGTKNAFELRQMQKQNAKATQQQG